MLSSYIEQLAKELKNLPETIEKPSKIWILLHPKKYNTNLITLEKKALLLKHLREVIGLAYDIGENTNWYHIRDWMSEFNYQYEQTKKP